MHDDERVVTEIVEISPAHAEALEREPDEPGVMVVDVTESLLTLPSGAVSGSRGQRALDAAFLGL